MPRVVGDRRHVYVDVEQLRAPGPGVDCVLQGGLGALCEPNPQVFNAVLVNAGVLNLFGMDPNSLPRLRPGASGRNGLIRHDDPSLQCESGVAFCIAYATD